MFECAGNVKNCTIQYAIFANNCYICYAVCCFLCIFAHKIYKYKEWRT